MDFRKAITFIRHECLSYQLPKDKNEFDKTKGEVLDFLQDNVVKSRINRIVEVEVLASNKEVIDELVKDIGDMNGRSFSKGKIRVATIRWKRD